MAAKPENSYIARVGRQLPPGLYAEKTNNPFRRGVPDMYYEGDHDIIWIEYKWYPNKPQTIDLSNTAKNICLSKHQQNWLKRSFFNKRNTAVIAGTPLGGIILPGLAWQTQHTMRDNILLTPKEVATWIKHKTMKS